jgi:hypothetical protein
VELVRQRPEVVAGVMKVQGLDGAGQAVVGQVPQLHRAIHDQIHHLGAAQTAPPRLG